MRELLPPEEDLRRPVPPGGDIVRVRWAGPDLPSKPEVRYLHQVRTLVVIITNIITMTVTTNMTMTKTNTMHSRFSGFISLWK